MANFVITIFLRPYLRSPALGTRPGGIVKRKAAILERQDIQVTASTLVQRAERAITQANPPAPLGRGKVVVRDDDFSQSTLRDMRAAHAKLSDADFEKRVAAAIETQSFD